MAADAGARHCITLIGAPGCGKTTLGDALAELYGLKIADLDREIERIEGCKVSEIFAAKGEKVFRDIESRVLMEVLDAGYDIVCCGGGTPCFGDNMRIINEKSTSVYLCCSEERLTERLCLYGASRPLVAGKSRQEIERYVRDLLQERERYYKLAAKSFDSSKLESKEEIENSAKEFHQSVIDRQRII